MEHSRQRGAASGERGPFRGTSSLGKPQPFSLLALQQSAGNQSLLRLLGGGGPPLPLGPPGDAHEREADRVASEVVSRPASPASARKDAAGGPSPSSSAVPRVLGSPGRPLDAADRSSLEPHFVRGLADVRVHTGERAAEAARSVEARAFTVGRDVVFAAGQYAPGTPAGRHLLAHELTHVNQQAGTGLRVQRSSFIKSIFPHPIETLERLFGGGTFSPKELLAYLETLATSKKIENDFDSDNKARLIVDLWYKGDPSFNLDNGFKSDKGAQLPAPDVKALLLEEMFTGYTSGADQKAINRILGHDPSQLKDLTDAYKRLTKKDLAASVRSNMDDEELAYALHLLLPRTAKQSEVATEGETVAADMKTTGKKMHWSPSGPGSGTDFEKWASASSEGPLPATVETTTMNCWEVVLLLAKRKGAVTWQWIHDLYVIDPKNFSANLVAKMSSGGLQISYEPAGNPPRIPSRGDIVFFDGSAHVALATGTRNGGKTEILSFWPPPDVIPYTQGTLDKVKVTSIEDIKQAWESLGKKFTKITYATPPW